MKRAIAVLVLSIALASPGIGSAKVDMNCSMMTSTSAVTGTVKNAKGQAVPGMTVLLYLTNSQTPTSYHTVTDAAGFYRICAGESDAAGHNTYDVAVRDLRPTPLYATHSQPYSTWANPTGDADFTPASGLPLRYMTNLTISPAEISTVASSRTVTWTVRSKAPASTVMKLRLGHLSNQEVTMASAGTEQGGPGNGGWNRWTHSATIAKGAKEALHWASVRGFDGSTQTTQFDRQPYTIDNKPPIIGPADASATGCGPGVTAAPFSPASPPGTTNPMPIIRHGVCDHWSDGARSGLDPFSLTGRMCRNAAMSSGCEDINPVLDTYTIVWWPSSPLALGDYYFTWRIADHAGNVAQSPTAHRLTITDRGGQAPRFVAVEPGNLGSGNTAGIVIGSTLTTPSSFPKIGFRVVDADGQRDLVPGSLSVRVFYGTEQNLVYEYDAFAAPNAYDTVSKRGGGVFNLLTGGFEATGYPLQGKPPGRYIATASITDHGGNAATVTWHWILAGAA